MLKAQLHSHINLDPSDKDFITYSVYDLVDEAKSRGYDVLAITCHDYFFNDLKVISYAKEKGILLISGIELSILGRHTLVYNCDEDIINVKSLEDLRKYKLLHPEILVIAAHPFYPGGSCHRNNIVLFEDVFDCYEYCFFYLNGLNFFNNKMLSVAKKFSKPVIGTSDIHDITDVWSTHCLIDSKLNIDDFILAIKKNKVKLVTKSYGFFNFVKLFIRIILRKLSFRNF